MLTLTQILDFSPHLLILSVDSRFPEAVCPFMTWFKDRNPKSLYSVFQSSKSISASC